MPRPLNAPDFLEACFIWLHFYTDILSCNQFNQANSFFLRILMDSNQFSTNLSHVIQIYYMSISNIALVCHFEVSWFIIETQIGKLSSEGKRVLSAFE